MAFTLAEYSKGKDDPRIQGLVEIYLNNAPFLNHTSLVNVMGSAATFTREKTLNTTAFRAIGAAYTASEGEVEEITTSLKIAGGKITVDRALLAMQGQERFAWAQAMQVKSLARLLSTNFFKGDGTSNSFEGLQSLIGAGQTIANGSGTPTALSLASLDEAIAELEGDNPVIYANTIMYSKFAQAMRNTSVAGNINFMPDEFGKQAMFYNDIPIVKAGRTQADAEILDFTEASTSTSLYVVASGEDGTVMFQNGGLNYYDIDRGQDVASEYDVEWYAAPAVQSQRSAIRVSEITNAAIVA
jgi:HK97 family phage major capsid protein